ncbi:MAG: aminotransferase class IV family protein [Candidatus Saccharibacteria bacterium]
MSPLVESIKLKDGVIYNMEYHQQRLNRSMKELFPVAAAVDLVKELAGIQIPSSGTYKVRVVYGPSIGRIEIEPYTLRSVNSLKVVYCNDIDYHLKFTDRQTLNDLYSQRENCDDIIIVKHGQITDSFSANLLFFDGQHWLTPDSPLLKGTQRQYLLDNGVIFERNITLNDLISFSKVGLINAMIDFDEMPIINLKDIYL